MTNLLRTGLLLASLTAIFMAVGYLIGGGTGMVLALAVAAATNLFAYWHADRMVLSLYGARPIARAEISWLHDVVAALAARARLPLPALYLIDSAQPNAFATGRDPQHAAVAVTSGLLALLEREEVAGVIAHELSHVRHRDTLTMTITATIAGAIGMLANFAFFFGFAGREEEREAPLGTVGAILMAVLAPIAAMLVQMAISRTREYAADRAGAEMSGNPEWLASALRKLEAHAGRAAVPEAERHPATAHLFIVNPLQGRNLATLFATHPATEERVRRLEAMAAARGTGSRNRTVLGTGPWGARRMV